MRPVMQFAVRKSPDRPRSAAGGRQPAIEIEVLAREAGLHPELVARLIRLGVLDAPVFPRDAAARLVRVTRLRRDLGLSYSGAIFAAQLLTRIDELEERLRRYEPRTNSNER